MKGNAALGIPAISEPCQALPVACEVALDVWSLMGGEWRPEAVAPAVALAQVDRFDGLIERLVMIRGLVAELREARRAD
jgi:hypothetical protein